MANLLPRRCIVCGSIITNSSGFVLARDFNNYEFNSVEGKSGTIRELCGKCALLFLLNNEIKCKKVDKDIAEITNKHLWELL